LRVYATLGAMGLACCGYWPTGLYAQQHSVEADTAAKLPDAPGAEAQAAGPEAVQAGTVSGTVQDPNGNVVEGVQVQLTSKAGGEKLEQPSGSNGEFSFAGLKPGLYKVTVSGKDWGTYSSPEIRLASGESRFLSDIVLPLATAVTEVRVGGTREEMAEEQVQIAEQQRVLGILPNFYSTYDWSAPPMEAKQKYKLAFRAAIDPVAFLGAAAIAGSEQMRGKYQGYGPGLEGYGKRYGAAYANQFSARMFSSAIFPGLFRQDPRYFYRGSGSVRTRALYAISRVVIARGDNGHSEPNFSYILGSFAAGGLSNLYYPAADRGVSLTITNSLIEIAGHAGNNLLREFVLRRLTPKVPSYANGKPVE